MVMPVTIKTPSAPNSSTSSIASAAMAAAGLSTPAAKARQTTLTLRASTAEFDALTNGSPRSW